MLPSVRNAAKQICHRAAYPTAEIGQSICALTSLRDLLVGLQPFARSSCRSDTSCHISGSLHIRAFSNGRISGTAGLHSGALEQPRQSSSSTASSAELPRMASSMQHAMTASALHTSSAAGAAAAPAAPAEETVSATAPVPPGRVQNTPPPPWTPTQQLKKRNFLPRRMGHLIQVLEQEAADKAASEKKFPDFQPGDILELKLVVPENKGRPATVKGLCIAKKNRGWRTAFTILNFIQGGGPVERSFPLYSPTLQSLSVIGRRKVRRAKLYYLRDRKPSEYRA